MPRRPRLFIPGQPQHVVARGHNRSPIVNGTVDCTAFVKCLRTAVSRYDIALHAWVLMTNHIHLLLTPGGKAELPGAMQWLGSHYGRYFNERYQRRGALWEGRYRSSLVDSERYLLLMLSLCGNEPCARGDRRIAGRLSLVQLQGEWVGRGRSCCFDP